MQIVIYLFSALFILMALAVLFAYTRIGHYGLLLIGLTYGASAGLALVLMHWWPLTAGFALVWGMKMLGLEPEVGQQSRIGERSKIRTSQGGIERNES